MSNADFTQGPWDMEHSPLATTIHIKDADLGTVCYVPVHCESFRHEQRANAHLIAASPDLVEALDACFDLIAADYKDHMAWPHAYHLAEAALAKAKGVPQ